jgi:putative hydrolase of the HAD superfamily
MVLLPRRAMYQGRMPADRFSHVAYWVFDLDNTLYPPQSRLFDQIDRRMTAYVMRTLGVEHRQADFLRESYWRKYGTTLAGLMRHHDLDPEPYLRDVHDIDFSVLSPDAELAAQIRALPGRKIVYTNGSSPYAQQVLEARGLSGLFDAIYGVEHADYRPKPEAEAFARVFGRDGLDTARAAMFEDDPRNLAVPHALGMRTVHVAPDPHDAPHIEHHTDDLAGFLARLRP